MSIAPGSGPSPFQGAAHGASGFTEGEQYRHAQRQDEQSFMRMKRSPLLVQQLFFPGVEMESCLFHPEPSPYDLRSRFCLDWYASFHGIASSWVQIAQFFVV